MFRDASPAVRLRSLLTDTLPYEVPVIFSNDKFYAGLTRQPRPALKEWIDRLRFSKDEYSVPYTYDIAKDEARSTSLSIVHPLAQKRLADFYDLHSGSLLNFCSNGRFSLRRPIALASPFSEGNITDDEARQRVGLVHALVEPGEPDLSHLTSYFAYGKYNLLGKFVGSREFLRLETRYLRYRTIDVSRCFYNIYTHSITWAVKSKDYSKEHKGAYSFESSFDQLMQRANYNETNGIVVGPEFSRIFAEIILQAIDRDLEETLFTQREYRLGIHYDIRRYVDDYFIFSNSDETLDQIEGCLRLALAKYKLYPNERKISTFGRPFVSAISLARQEMGGLLTGISRLIREVEEGPEAALAAGIGRQIAAQIRSTRLIVAKHQIAFANVSGWLMSRLKRLNRRCLKMAANFGDPTHRQLATDVSISLLETALYICAVDLRVRTTYSVCQLALALQRGRALFTSEQHDLIDHLLMDECANMLRVLRTRNSGSGPAPDSVEAYNLLICGAQFVGDDFLRSTTVLEFLDDYLSNEISYFAFITLKFCFLKNRNFFADRLHRLNWLAEARVRAKADVSQLRRNTEEYLILCDYLASPDVERNAKRTLYTAVYGGMISNALIDELGQYVGFADWTGLSVEHLLRRKELRPVYAWG